VVSAACLLAIEGREDLAEPTGERTRLVAEIGAGLRLVAGDPYFRVLIGYGAVANLALTGWQALEVVFLVRVVGATSSTVGVVVAVIGVGGVGGALAARKIAQRFGTGHGLLICALATAPFGLLVPLAGPGIRLALFTVGGAIVSAGIVAANVIGRSFRQLYCPAPLLGRLTATMSTLAYSAIPLGALIAGSLGTLIGTRNALWVMTSALAASAAILLIGPIHRHRDLPATHPSLLPSADSTMPPDSDSTTKPDPA